MPKAKGDPYFISARVGAEEAARELNVDLIWDGPTSLDASQQNELVETWITRCVDAIVVAVENKGSISTVLRKARQHGIAVLTWDADAEPDVRDFFLNQATPEGIANALTDEAARLLPPNGQFAIITGALSAENQNEWIADVRKQLAARYPGLTLATIQPSDDRDKSFADPDDSEGLSAGQAGHGDIRSRRSWRCGGGSTVGEEGNQCHRPFSPGNLQALCS